MKKLTLLIPVIVAVITLASCAQNRVYNVSSISSGYETVISSEHLMKGDTVRIGYDIAGREIATKDLHGYYIGHIAIVK